MKRNEEALKYFDFAIEKNPQDAVYLIHKGIKEKQLLSKHLM